MIVEDLFKYYNKELTFYSKVPAKYKIISNIFFILGIIAYLSFFYFFSFEKEYIYILLASIALFLPIFIKRYLNIKYEWKTQEFNKLISSKLSRKLKGMDLNLDLVQKQITEKASKEKASSVINISVLGALLVPLWGIYIVEIMKTVNGDIKGLTTMFSLLFILALGVSILVSSMSLLKDQLLKNYQKWNKLNDLITDYRITLKP